MKHGDEGNPDLPLIRPGSSPALQLEIRLGSELMRLES